MRDDSRLAARQAGDQELARFALIIALEPGPLPVGPSPFPMRREAALYDYDPADEHVVILAIRHQREAGYQECPVALATARWLSRSRANFSPAIRTAIRMQNAGGRTPRIVKA